MGRRDIGASLDQKELRLFSRAGAPPGGRRSLRRQRSADRYPTVHLVLGSGSRQPHSVAALFGAAPRDDRPVGRLVPHCDRRDDKLAFTRRVER